MVNFGRFDQLVVEDIINNDRAKNKTKAKAKAKARARQG